MIGGSEDWGIGGLDIGHWSLDTGHWTRVTGPWAWNVVSLQHTTLYT